MFRPLKITFYLDGTGFYHTPNDPIHLDALLAFCASIRDCRETITRGDVPDDISIPVKRWKTSGDWGWMCSALQPAGPVHHSTEYIRSRFRSSRAHLTTGKPNLTNGIYRDFNIPVTLTLCHQLEAWCFGERRKIRRELRRHIKFIGKKRSIGKGRVVDITVEECDEDFSIRRNGTAMRFLPDPDGARTSRVRPPYWNSHGAISVCEIGDEITW